MNLSQLTARVKNASIAGDTEIAIGGITQDSRLVEPGFLFVCLRGANHDGHRYAADAFAKGAAAIVVEAGGLASAGVSLPVEAVVVTVPDTRLALPLLACAFYGDPSQSVTMIGVTGTNGKTTTTRLLAAILRAAGQKVGTIGTLGAELDGTEIPSEHTTPEADALQGLLATMRDGGANAIVMEVSSHALALHRTDGIAFSAGVFTNITQDHLDFHGTMEAYFEAKSLLFAEYPIRYPRPNRQPFLSVINVAQWEGRDLVTMARGDVITYAAEGSPAVLTARNITLTAEGASFEAVYDSGVEKYAFSIRLNIGGAFQVANALGAIAACLRMGIAKETIAAGLANLTGVPGRFEAVPTDSRGFSVIVDYAHTPDGLKNLLDSARALNPARILLVFGCGGNRDTTKRPIMGRLGATLAEWVVVTSDNPRKEAPTAILADIVAGIDSLAPDERKGVVQVEADRRTAIGMAMAEARPGDIVLIAGKGHEDYQIIGDTKHHFDDREVAREALLNLPSPPDPLSLDSRFAAGEGEKA